LPVRIAGYFVILQVILASSPQVFEVNAFSVQHHHQVRKTMPMVSFNRGTNGQLSALTHRPRGALSNLRGGGIERSGSASKLYMSVGPEIIFNNAPMYQSFAIIAATNVLGLGISLLTGSHLHLDLLGTGAFAVASLPTLLSTTSSARVTLSSSAVAIWGTKLASFLFFRALKIKTDGRLDDTLSTTSGTIVFWFISILWGIICGLPHTLGTTSSNPGSPIALTVGGAIYVLGLVTESLADYQKWQFKNANPGQFCNVGLWSVTQHPNFFGNLLLWFGIFIMNAGSLIVIPDSVADGGGAISNILSTLWASRRAFIALLSPLFMWTLFSGQATGTMMNSLELANSKYGSDPSYQSYVKDVPLIIPNIFKWLRKLLPF